MNDLRITKDVYDKKHQEYHDQMQSLNLELEEHDKGNFEYHITVARVFSLATRAQELFESSETDEKRAFLNYLLQNPTVKRKKPVFPLRSPYDTVLKVAGRPNRGARRESNSHHSFHRAEC